MRLSTEIQPRIADINYLKESAYDYTKWNLGDSITFNDGVSDIDKYINPHYDVLRPNEESTAFLVSAIWAYKFSEEISYLWAAENVATASNTRRIMLWEINNFTGARQWLGFITMTLASSTAHTLRDFRVDVKTEITGTVAVSGTAVTGSGTQFNTNRVAVGARIGFGSTDPTQITTWYRISAIASDTGATLSVSAGVIGAGTPYVIQEFRPILLYTNATLTNGGIHIGKGVAISDYQIAGTTIGLAVSTDNQKASYWIKDAASQTNTIGAGIAIDADAATPTNLDCYVLDLVSAGNYRVFKYNLRAALTVASGASVSAWVLTTGNNAFTGTGSQNSNLTLATTSHGGGSGIKSLYFISNSRFMRAAVSGITSGNTTWIQEAIAEIPTGGTNTYALTSALSGLVYVPNTDSFVICTTSASGVFSYVTKFVSSGSQFNRIFGRNMLNLDMSTADLGSPSTFTNSSVALGVTTDRTNKVYISKTGTTSSNMQIYALAFGADDEYAFDSEGYIITPEIITTDANKFYRVFVNQLNYQGSLSLGRSTEPIFVYARTSNIQTDATTGWQPVNDISDISAFAGAPSIQFLLTSRTIGDIILPAKIRGINLEYEDNTTDSHYAISVEKCSVVSKIFAWWFAVAFGGTVPTLRVNLYDADSGGLILTDTTAASANGVWEKTTDGTNWVAYNTSDRGNTTTWIRYTPNSLADNIKVAAYLIQA
jgi:hypothetical protein